ncbi:MAG TPA: TerC family protein [Bacillus bacterium]|nr:TerC family protein [Bacillus sp. (in: firmicutes)]
MTVDLDAIITVVTIIGIDIILGGDNAVVIAMASKNLPKDQRNKVIIWGAGLAVILRTILTIFAMILLKIPYLTLIGGILLIGVAIGLVMGEKSEKVSVKAGTSLASAISTIVLADIIMGLDNVLAVAGAANGNYFYVMLGLIVSIPIIISGSKLMLFLLDKVPYFMYLGAAILAYTAGKMIAHDEAIADFTDEMTAIIPIIIVIVVLFWCVLSKKINYILLRK